MNIQFCRSIAMKTKTRVMRFTVATVISLVAAVIVFIVAVVPNACAAEPTTDRFRQMSGAELQTLCTAPEQASKSACTFYIMGLREGISTGASLNRSNKRDLLTGTCIPDQLTEAGMELVVKMKLGEDLTVFPTDRDLPAVSIVSAAMFREFPCTKQWK